MEAFLVIKNGVLQRLINILYCLLIYLDNDLGKDFLSLRWFVQMETIQCSLRTHRISMNESTMFHVVREAIKIFTAKKVDVKV